MDHDCSSDADDSRDEYEEKLAADAQAQIKAAYVFLANLVAQMENAQGMFVFEVPLLYLLAARIDRQGIPPCCVRLLVVPSEHSAEQAFSHAGLP